MPEITLGIVKVLPELVSILPTPDMTIERAEDKDIKEVVYKVAG